MFEGFRRFFRDPTGGDDRNALDIFLLVGFLIVCAIIWRMILRHLLAE